METGKIFSFGLIAFILLACPFTTPVQEANNIPPAQNVPPTPEPSVNSTLPPPPPDGNAQLEAQWALITKGNVEKACLSSAKAEAKSRGYSESLVFSCSCTAQESDSYKSYGCSISAADGSHALSAACTKSDKSCVINSEQGTVTYTFEEIAQMQG
jgi:hypothetical protein